MWAAWLGVLSHVVFDIYSGATIRLLWPFTSHAFSMPVVAMADPLAIGVLVVGAMALWVWPRDQQPQDADGAPGLVSGVKLTTRGHAALAPTYRVASAHGKQEVIE